MYGVEVSLVCAISEEKKDYFQMSQNVTQIIGKTTGQGQLSIELIKEKTTVTEDVFVCTLSATAKERTIKAEVPPIYYAFGDPATSLDRAIDYTTLKYPDTDIQAKVFVKLDSDGLHKSVCIIRNGIVECFKNNNWEEERIHVTEVFSDIECGSSDISPVYCHARDFYCGVRSDGCVECFDESANFICGLNSGGAVACHLSL